MPADNRTPDAAMDADALYREEIVTDRKIGTIRMLVPIAPDGSADASRKTVYSGEAQIMTNMGTLPVSFDIDADNLADAERTMKELQELRRQASSGLIVPPAGAAAALTGGGGGGLGGGGKIQLP
jgi:hypothetical protein